MIWPWGQQWCALQGGSPIGQIGGLGSSFIFLASFLLFFSLLSSIPSSLLFCSPCSTTTHTTHTTPMQRTESAMDSAIEEIQFNRDNTHKNPFKKLMRTRHTQSQINKAAFGPSTIESDAAANNTKKILFELPEAEISVYKQGRETPNSSFNGSNSFNSNSSVLSLDSMNSVHNVIKHNQSSLIAQGRFQIYQINSALSYLSCGSLTHPILPLSTIIKISGNTYIIPIKNQSPTRYWRLTLNSVNDTVLGNFENIMKLISKFQSDLLVDYTIDSPFCTSILETASIISIKRRIRNNTADDSADDADDENDDSVSLKSYFHVDSEDEIEPIDHALTLHQPIPTRPTSTSTNYSMASSVLDDYNNKHSASSSNTSHITFNNDVESTRKGSDIHALSDYIDNESLHDTTPNNNNNDNATINHRDTNDNSRKRNNSSNNHSVDSDLDFNLDLDLEEDFELTLDMDAESEIGIYPEGGLENPIISTSMNSENMVNSTTITSNTTNTMGKRSLSIADTDDLDTIDLDDDDLLCMWNNSGDGLTKRYSLSFKAYDLKKPISIDIFDKYRKDLASVIKKDIRRGTGLLGTYLDI